MNSVTVEESFLDFKCPYCGSLNSFPTSVAGLVRECLNCLETFIVPKAGEEVGHRLPFPLEIEKIRLRKLTAGDWRDLVEFEFETEDAATEWLYRQDQVRLTSPDQTFSLGVEDKAAQKIVGILGLKFLDPAFNQIEVSLSLSASAKNGGLEAEIFSAALDFCFRDLHVHRVVAHCVPENTELQRVFEDLGMRKEAEFIKHYFLSGEWRSTVWFAMLEEEYFPEEESAQSPA